MTVIPEKILRGNRIASACVLMKEYFQSGMFKGYDLYVPKYTVGWVERHWFLDGKNPNKKKGSKVTFFFMDGSRIVKLPISTKDLKIIDE